MDQANPPQADAAELAAANWINAGNAAFERGALRDAHEAFREAHSSHASHLSHYSLGVVAEAESRESEASAFYAAAVAADPFFVPARVNLGHLLRRAGHEGQSFHHMLVAHALAPDHMLTVYGLAESAVSADRPDLAAALLPRLLAHADAWPLAARIEQVIGDRRDPDARAPGDISHVVDTVSVDFLEAIALLDPADSATWTDFGNELLAAGRTSEAIAIQQQAVIIDPLGLAPTNNLSVALRAGGRAQAAADSALVALAIKPDWVCAWANLARAYGDAGALEQAWDAWHLACSGPHEAAVDWLAALAELSRRLGRRDYALAVIDRIARLRPDDYMVPNNRGAYLLDAGQAEAALNCFEDAARLNPSCALPLSNCGAACELLGRYGEASDYYRRALALSGDDPGLRARLVHVSQHLCDWSDLNRQAARLTGEIRGDGGATIQPFSLLAIPGLSGRDMRRVSERYVRQYAESAPAAMPLLSSRRPRIGYLSSDLYGHATAWLIAEILERHDAGSFDIHLYSFGDAPEDETRLRLRAACPRFLDLNGMSDADAAARIRADGIDILIDLKGYTRGARPQILAFRPAPIQINYLGFPGTMGASFIDYIIADETIIPQSLEHQYTEKVLRLPHCYQPNDRRRPLPPCPSRASLGLPENGIVLCSFNAPYKLTPEMFDIWCRLLREVEDSCLWLLAGDEETNANLVREAQSRGVAASRLVFAPRSDLPSHLARFRAADLFLDSFPCTAHTTASDALWCGVPVVTRTGETFASRVAASVVAAAGLPELVARSAEDYHRLAFGLATDRAMLAECKARLEATRLSCPLFDSAAHTRDLETLYRQALEAGR